MPPIGIVPMRLSSNIRAVSLKTTNSAVGITFATGGEVSVLGASPFITYSVHRLMRFFKGDHKPYMRSSDCRRAVCSDASIRVVKWKVECVHRDNVTGS